HTANTRIRLGGPSSENSHVVRSFLFRSVSPVAPPANFRLGEFRSLAKRGRSDHRQWKCRKFERIYDVWDSANFVGILRTQRRRVQLYDRTTHFWNPLWRRNLRRRGFHHDQRNRNEWHSAGSGFPWHVYQSHDMDSDLELDRWTESRWTLVLLAHRFLCRRFEQ